MLSCSESEIKINNHWHLAELVNITDNEFILKLKEDDKIIEYKTDRLLLKKPSSSFSSSFKPSSNVYYSLNQQIEFYSNIQWIEGQIKAKKGLFYLIAYIDQDKKCNKIMGSDLIRELTSISNLITLDINNCVRISLKNWSSLSFAIKKIAKLIDKLYKLLKDITFIFSANFTLFVFGDSIEFDLLNELIDTALDHFVELEKEAKFKEQSIMISHSQDNTRHHNVHKETIILEKIVYDIQKSKIDQLKKSNQSIKIEYKNTKNPNEVSVSVSSKDIGLFTEAKNLLGLIQKYVLIPLKENESFFTSQKENEKNLIYFAKLYGIVDYNFFKNDDKSTTIRLIGQSDMIDYFTRSVISFCEKNELLKEKENTISQIKHQILNLS